MFQGHLKIFLKRSERDENMSSQMCHFGSRILYELEEIKTQKAWEKLPVTPLSVCVSYVFATPLTLLSVGISRQEYWNGLPCPPPGDRPNPDLLHCRQILYHLSHP